MSEGNFQAVTKLESYKSYIGLEQPCNHVTHLTHVTAAPGQIPPILGQHRSNPLWLIPACLAVLAVSAVLYFFNPTESAFYPTCAFYRATGLLCPGCGSLRAIHQLLHGHLAAALRFNALLVCGFPVAAWFGVRFLAGKIRGENPQLTIPTLWIWLGFGLLVSFGLLRNLPFNGVRWLAP